MVSVPKAQRPRGRQHFRHSARGELVVIEDGWGQVAGFSQQQMRLLLALEGAGGRLPKRAATRAMRGNGSGPLTPSARASAARAVTRLATVGLVERSTSDLALTDLGVSVIADHRPSMLMLLSAQR